VTHIISGYKTKKELKENLHHEEAGSGRRNPYFEDPSLFAGAWSGFAADMKVGQSLVCTNHPKRSWFAKVTRTAANKWKVE
jgi:hypothetical protein